MPLCARCATIKAKGVFALKGSPLCKQLQCSGEYGNRDAEYYMPWRASQLGEMPQVGVEGCIGVHQCPKAKGISGTSSGCYCLPCFTIHIPSSKPV